MARKNAPSNQGAIWTTKDFAAIRRLVKTGATGKTIAKKIGRSVVALYQKASIEGISLSTRQAVQRSAVAKKAKAVAARLIRDVGFAPVDAGPSRIARYLEPFSLAMAQLAYEGDEGPEIAYRIERFGK